MEVRRLFLGILTIMLSYDLIIIMQEGGQSELTAEGVVWLFVILRGIMMMRVIG